MIVRLHNLSARSPVMADLKSVTELMITCDIAESGITDPTEEDVRNAWQTPNFNLRTDAWVIVTRKGQIVGYADVRRGEHEQLASSLRVHPDYRGRGIGTLLIWLVEERARQLIDDMPSDARITLISTVSSFNQVAHRLLEREGYTLVRSFWRPLIEMDEMADQSQAPVALLNKIKVDLVVDSRNMKGTMQLPRRTGIYVARQYDVYEKELRAGGELVEGETLNMQCATA